MTSNFAADSDPLKAVLQKAAAEAAAAAAVFIRPISDFVLLLSFCVYD